MKFEVIEVERKSAIRRLTNQTAYLVDDRRSTVAGKPHHFVLVLVDREAEIGGKRRVQHAERMRKSHFTRQRNRGAAVRAARPVTDRERRPFSHPIRRQDRGAIGGSGEKRRRGVRLMMTGEKDLPGGRPEVGRNRAAYPDLFTKRAFHRLGKCLPRARKGT